MAIDTFTTLSAAVASWLARDDLTALIPDFITLAEAKINRTLLHPGMEHRAIVTVDTGTVNPELISLPSGFQTMRAVRLSGVTGKPRLSFMTQTQIEDYRYSIDNVSGQPVYFSIIGDSAELAPTPNQNFDVQMVYRANVAPLNATNPTNPILALAPDLYLYGALLESMPYTGNDARISVWGSAFATCLDQLNIHGERQSFDSGPTTVSLPGVTP